MRCGVEGVILHVDVILNSCSSPPPQQGQGEAICTLPVVDRVLRRLRYSGIPIVDHLPDFWVSLYVPVPTHHLARLVTASVCIPRRLLYTCMHVLWSHGRKSWGLCFLNGTFALFCNSDVTRVIQKSWGEDGGEKILYVIPGDKEELGIELASCGWVVVVLISGLPSSNQSVNSDMIYIHSLIQLPSIICGSIKKTANNDILRVGYIMKPSREEDFAKRGAFPMCPTPTRLVFMPLSFELPLSSQLEEVDLVLHKATDEIISVNLNMSSEVSGRINYSKGMQEVKSYLEHHKQVCVIDPFDKVYPIVDRLEIQQILSDLKDLDSEGNHVIRGPKFFKVDIFDKDVILWNAKGNFPFPCIVKSQVACGVPDAHSMGIAFEAEDLKNLTVPVPAIVQEYVDHFSTSYKFYVLGDVIFHAVKRSMPNGCVLRKLSESNGLKPLLFDSLKSLPTATRVGDDLPGNGASSKDNSEVLDFDLIARAAKWLSDKLGLTIFGFDVVVQEGTLDHVIVDINYFPSFKEVPDDVAVPAFWTAIRRKFESSRKRERTAPADEIGSSARPSLTSKFHHKSRSPIHGISGGHC